MKVRLVIVDDHPLILDGLEALFRAAGDCEVAARCADGAEALAAVRRERPDVLVLNLRMPVLDGWGVLRRLQEEGLAARAVLFTSEIREDEIEEAVRLGVRGLVFKRMPGQVLLDCVRRVAAGGMALEERSVRRALEGLLRRRSAEREISERLTPRELEMVLMVGQGLRNRDIAERLGISANTVKIHFSHIYAKLGVDSRLALYRYAGQRGLFAG